jgi:exodeoxyribonuclease VII large subunit
MSAPQSNLVEFTVSELAQAVRRSIEDQFDWVRVRGEISGFKGQHSSGHSYFTLKDADASIEAVIWKTSWPRLQFKPAEGLEVIAMGRLTTFPKSSKYQLIIDQLQPAGAGALMVLLEERRKKLAAEGLFAKERKRPLPYVPRCIGVVTSPTGAVIRDILHRLNDRFPMRVLVWPVRVQGETCAPEVAAAIRGFNAIPEGGRVPRPDLIIVARGGGSIEDLWGFNEEMVVRAVVESAIPIISGVGHETDTTLIDYAADLRAPTPTAAAEAAVPVRGELIAYVDELGGRTRNAMRRTASSARDRFRAAGAGLPRPENLLGLASQRLDRASTHLRSGLAALHQRKALTLARTAPKLSVDALRNFAQRERKQFALWTSRLAPALDRLLTRRKERVTALDRLLESYSYRNVLDRGFAVVTADGKVVDETAKAKPGQALLVEVADGTFGATVGSGAATPRPRRRKATPDGQQSLF